MAESKIEILFKRWKNIENIESEKEWTKLIPLTILYFKNQSSIEEVSC